MDRFDASLDPYIKAPSNEYHHGTASKNSFRREKLSLLSQPPLSEPGPGESWDHKKFEGIKQTSMLLHSIRVLISQIYMKRLD